MAFPAMDAVAAAGEPAQTAQGPAAAKLSADLRAFLDAHANHEPVTLAQVERALAGRGFALMIAFMALPFCVVPIPGLSTPFGAAIALMGFRLALGQRPWLPRFIVNHRMEGKRLRRVLSAGVRWSERLERFIRPRFGFMEWPVTRRLIGLCIAYCGFILFLPLPIPLSNTFPAFALVLLSLGLMERDGALVLGGFAGALLGSAYIATFPFLAFLAARAWCVGIF